jgi:hypothetical protein
LKRLGLPLSEKQIPQVVEKVERGGGKPKEALETAALRPRQARQLADDSNLPGVRTYSSVETNPSR